MMFEKLNMKEQVALLTELRVRNDHVCKYKKCLYLWWILDKINNNNIEIKNLNRDSKN